MKEDNDAGGSFEEIEESVAEQAERRAKVFVCVFLFVAFFWFVIGVFYCCGCFFLNA